MLVLEAHAYQKIPYHAQGNTNKNTDFNEINRNFGELLVQSRVANARSTVNAIKVDGLQATVHGNAGKLHGKFMTQLLESF